jgi:hypothetical protein
MLALIFGGPGRAAWDARRVAVSQARHARATAEPVPVGLTHERPPMTLPSSQNHERALSDRSNRSCSQFIIAVIAIRREIYRATFPRRRVFNRPRPLSMRHVARERVVLWAPLLVALLALMGATLRVLLIV